MTMTEPTQTAASAEISPDLLREALRLMLTIRHFEERALALYRAGEMRGTTHPSIGNEAAEVGAILTLRPQDWISSTHRGHGHTIAKGGDVKKMMAELLGKVTGYSGGKGGSMHIADMERGMLGANGIVGAGIGLATGAALTCQLQGTGGVGVSFFGDGALNQGLLHECSNMAAIWKLPVVFICENNFYAQSARSDWSIAGGQPARRAEAYGLPGVSVDGMDFFAVHRAAGELVERARRGDGPSYLVCNTYRYHGHHAGDPLNYREKTEVDEWRPKDPVDRMKRDLIARGVMHADDIDDLERRVITTIDAAEEFAKTSPEPTVDALMTDIYA